MVRRAVILGALVLCLVGTPAAHAHGVLRASDPADRAVLEQAPTAVTLSFTEAPEPRLSSVQVLDGSGASFGAGDVAVVPGDPETLRLDLRTLPRGVYTVNWRIVSRVDGHLTAGTIAFGVQEPVTSAATVPAASVPSNRSAGAVGGRVLLYAGVTVLLGVAWTAIGLFGGRRRRGLHVLAVAGWAALAAGILLLGAAQRASTGVSVDVFLGTRLGHAWLWRTAGLVVAGAGLLVARRRWRSGMGLVAPGTILVVVAHVEAGHAAAGSWPWAIVGLQVVHVTAMAVWIGGLAALLVGTRAPGGAIGPGPEDRSTPGRPGRESVARRRFRAKDRPGGPPAGTDETAAGRPGRESGAWRPFRAKDHSGRPAAGTEETAPAGPGRESGAWRPFRAKEQPGGPPTAAMDTASSADVAVVRRYSAVAGVAIGVLAATGVVRAIDAVGGWAPLWDTGYGRLVLVKAGLLVVLAGLGAINRYRNVGRSLTGLRRVGATELAVASAVFVVTGFLTTSPPPATAKVSAPEVVLTASDFGTTVKARLTVSPAQPGDNRFTLRLADYDSGQPVAADRVTARFALPAYPGASPSSLELAPTTPGTFAASGTNLSLPGRWTVVLVIERGAGSLELTMELTTRTPPPPLSVARAPGQPTITTATLPGGSTLQTYVDPERPGPTELHLTFFTPAGTEEAVASAAVTAGDTDAPTPRRLGPGHFVVDVTAPSGPWPVEVTAVTAAGDYLYTPLDLEISP